MTNTPTHATTHHNHVLINLIHLILADRFFPSSKTCSRCGTKKQDLTLADRIFSCDCGLVIDRDLNAAIMLNNYSS